MTNLLVTRTKSREITIDGEDTEMLGFFSGRQKIGEFGVDEILRGDNWAEELAEFIKAKPRTYEQCEDFLLTEEGEEFEEDEEESEGGSVVPQKYRERYGAAQNCGDEIAIALTNFVTLPRKKGDIDGGLDRSKLRAVAEVNGIGDKLADWETRETKAGNPLNGGLLRMNTSNVLRGMNRRGEEVTIGTIVWPAREVEPKAKKSRAKSAK